MPINQNWKLGRRSSSCHHSGRSFEDGETIVTAVIPLPETEEFERRDFTVEAWDEIRGETEPFSFWRTRFEVPVPVPKKEEIVEKEGAESLLRRLIDEDDSKTENARYVLAVMLERKRTLKEVERKDAENGSRLLIYEHPKTGDVLIVRDPMLRLDEVEPVQEEVSALLAPKPAPAETDSDGDVEEAAGNELDSTAEENTEAAEEPEDATSKNDESGASEEEGEAVVESGDPQAQAAEPETTPETV